MKISNSTYVKRAPSDVFVRLCDLRFLGEVDPDIEAMEKLTDGPIAVGTVFRTHLRPPGLKVTSRSTRDLPRSARVTSTTPTTRRSSTSRIRARC